MKVICEQCQSEYNIDESRIPPEGLQIKCPRCTNTFVVTRLIQPSETAGDLFDLGCVDLSETGSGQQAPEPPPSQSEPLFPETDLLSKQETHSPVSTLPPLGDVGDRSAFSPFPSKEPSLPPLSKQPAPAQDAKGKLFDFIDHDIGKESGSQPNETVRYRIRRKSGKVFGPFDAETIQKMLADHQLIGNEEASTDGYAFKPLGSFEEFADTIRLLMDESAVPESPVEEESESSSGVTLAPKGVEFAEPPPDKKRTRQPGAMLFFLVGFVFLIVVIGVVLGFTKYGWFGYRLITGTSRNNQATPKGTDGSPRDNLAIPGQLAEQFIEDTFWGYESIVQSLQKKIADDDATLDELYLAGLSYATLLRNYGANETYLAQFRTILGRMQDEDAESPKTIKVQAASLVLNDAPKASSMLGALIAKDAKDTEAFFLLGWSLAFQKKWKESIQAFEQSLALDPSFNKANHALGDIFSLQGDFDQALTYYQKAYEKNPRHCTSAVEQARILIEVKGQDSEGEKLLQQVVGDNFKQMAPSERAKAYSLNAKIYAHRHENDKAIAEYKQAIALAPNRPEYLAALGDFYIFIGDFSQALTKFDEALAKAPQNVDALVGKGQAMWKTGNIVKAKVLLEETAKMANKDPRPMYLLGQLDEDLEKPEDALAKYRHAVELNPKYLQARAAIARFYLKQNKSKEALDELAAVTTLNPQSAILSACLGEVYLKQGNLRLAKQEFEKALEIDPDMASAHFLLANVLRELNDFQTAMEHYKQVAQISPLYPDLQLELGYTLYLQKKYEEALKLFQEAIHTNPRNDKLYVKAGLAAEALDDTKGAIQFFQSAIGLNSTSTEAYYHLGLMFQIQKDHEKALDVFKQTVELDKNNADAHYRMGISYLAMESPRDAIEELEQAIKLNPAHTDALFELGKALVMRQQYDQAIRHFSRILQKFPKRTDVQLELGDTFFKRGNYNKALASYQKANRQNAKLPGLAYRLGRTFDELEKKQKAIQFYIKAIKEQPEDAMPHFYLGHIYKAQRKNRRAVDEFQKYLDIKPDAPDADEVREEIDYLENE